MNKGEPPRPLFDSAPPRAGGPGWRIGHAPAWALSLLLAVIALAAYLFFAGAGRFDFTQSMDAHHVLMADALLHGQLHIREEALQHKYLRLREVFARDFDRHARTPEGGRPSAGVRERFIHENAVARLRHDWVIQDRRLYGYWGILTPAVFTPIVAIFGLDVSDRIACALIGSVNVGLFYLVLRRFSDRGLAPTGEAARVLLTLLFALGTSHFWISCAGAVWFTTQVLSLTAFLLALLACTGPRNRPLAWLAAGAALGLAALGRATFLLTAPCVVLLLVARARTSSERLAPRAVAVRVAAFALPLAAACAAQAWYNAARFGDPRESGLALQVGTGGHERYQADYRAHGLFSLHYLPHNAWYYFVNAGGFVAPDGTWTFDPEGYSILLMTPPLLLIAGLARRWSSTATALAAGVVPALASLLIFIGTGWVQFGPRYLLDVTPLLLLLTALGMRGRVGPLSVGLTALAILVQTYGAVQMSLLQ